MQKLNLFILSFILLLAACAKDESNGNEPEKGEIAYAELSLSYGTRADGGTPGTTDENKVSQMVVYIFNADDDTPDSENHHIVIPSWVDGQSYTISVQAGNKIFFALANVAPSLTPATLTLAEVRDLKAGHLLDNTNSRDIPTDGIPMGGESEVTVNAGEHNVPVTIDIHRTFSKLQPLKVDDNITVTLSGEELKELFDDTADAASPVEFDLEAYYVINGIKESYILPKYDKDNERDVWVDWNLGEVGKYFSSVYNTTSKEPDKVYSGDGTAAWIQKDATTNVFVYENSPIEATSTLGAPGFDKKSVCALILKGTLTYDGDPAKKKTRYWRLNLAYDYDYKLFRNVQYAITLESISSKGYETPEEAEEDEDGGEVVPPKGGTSVSATINILNWRNISLGQGV